MELLDKILSNISVIKKMQEASKTDLVLSISNASIGEKILSIYSLKEPAVIVVKNAVEMQDYREGFANLGLKVSECYADVSAPIFMQFCDNLQEQEMLKNLYDFLIGKTQILLLAEEMLFCKFPHKITVNDFLKLEKNKEYKINQLIQKLIEKGYKKCEKVEKIGDFSVRGDIIDIFSSNYENPIRLDFWGDTLDKMYFFEVQDMQKINEIENVNLYPINLFVLNPEEKQNAINKLKNSLLNYHYEGDSLIKIHSTINMVCERLIEGGLPDDLKFLRPFLATEYSIIDILKDNAKIFIDEPKRLYDNLENDYKSISSSLYDFISGGELLSEHVDYFFDVKHALKFTPNYMFVSFEQNIFKTDVNVMLRTIGSRKYTFDYRALVSDLNIYVNSKYKVILFAGSLESKKSITEFLIKNGIVPVDTISLVSGKSQIYISEERYNYSCSFLDSAYIFIGTDDLIKKTRTDIKNTSISSKKKKVFYLPKVGDYVVHETHGIGHCVALEKLNFNGTEKDYFIIEYSGGDKLYLPSEQADLISAYMGGDESPKLNKIGGAQFAKIKEKVKESVSKLAVNLIEIYSKREKAKGFVYSPDNYLYEEFENAFPYEETEDQLTAIADIKKDMEGTKIMDRLICGDVGYGKTEVALRAIYKAIIDGKQVAFLCPTTILSEQHYKTAKQRFENFLVNVAVLNRFRNKQQQNEIVKNLKDGKVDLIIGTHRLLSSDIQFKNLGLLILDEEQRFGVGDKEKIKELKKDVDVLTLSATPIPRTLNMALTGIRDISIIETPPKERLAVQTFVVEESDSLILDACKKEINRGGQVLFVYNRVEHIYEQAERIKRLLPDARIGVAHGQMPEKILEDTIYKLYNKEFDILIATTLIESGIDLPLANTLIVIDSDRLGLAQLYQLKGRIGRSDKLAYAYFTYNPTKILTDDAYKRLDAILEFTELGSGFKIAMRDLEIRGAGNVLGKEQHGHLEKVGYEMYCKLLENAIKEIKGERINDVKPIKIDIMASANLPESFVASEDERIKFYTQISSVSNETDLQQITKVLQEAYGNLPQETIRLMKIAYIKNLAIKIDAKRVFVDKNNTKIYLYKQEKFITDKTNKALCDRANGVLKFEDVPIIEFDLKYANVDQKIDFVLNFLKDCTTD